MIYTSTSLQEVVARVVRNTRLQDSSYYKDMEEWIPEAMGYMKTRFQLQPRWKDVCVRFHKVRMPCGLVTLKAIQYGACRLRYYNSPRTPDSIPMSDGTAASVYPGIPLQGTTTFGTQIVKRPANDDGIPVEFYETNLQPVESMPEHPRHWYFTELDHINTSFRDSWIRVHYSGIPTDEQGLPLIPDEENYKEALYWYCRAKMIEAGYEDKVFRHDQCMSYFDTYAPRARSRITYPSPDQQEAKMANLTRLIFPENYWETFYHPGRESFLNTTDRT